MQSKLSTEDYASLQDQFAPFNMPCFGCDMRAVCAGGGARFDGTLFRFPLRSGALARGSEITKAAYVEREGAAAAAAAAAATTTVLLLHYYYYYYYFY